MKTKHYDIQTLNMAISAIHKQKQKIRTVANQYKIPKSTLFDRIKKPLVTQRQIRLLTKDEEEALVAFVTYQAKQGFPMTRAMIRCYIKEILRRGGRESSLAEGGPSDKWFRGLLKRHPAIAEKTPEPLDKARARMSSEKTVTDLFGLLARVLEENGLTNKESQIFNADETGWSGKEKSRRKVIGSKHGHCFTKRNLTNDHITANLCISADGRMLPPMIIYKESYPHSNFYEGVPESWLFGMSQSGYMDGDLFLSWFRRVFLRNCGRERPVVLILDNHDSHITLQLVEAARENDVIPAHTTHILQPLDVKINGPLKARFSGIAANLGFATPNLTIGKARFPLVLKHAIEQTRPSSIKEAFRVTGIMPHNPNAIDKTQLIPSTFTKRNEETATMENTSVKTCVTCGSFLVNPLVDQGLIPESMASILIPPANKTVIKTNRPRVVSEGRVISGDEVFKQLKEKEERAARIEKDREERLAMKERRKKEKEEEQEQRLIKRQRKEEERKFKLELKEAEKIKRALGGRLADKKYTCGVCGERGRLNDEANGVMWYGCDESLCGRWFHEECMTAKERTYLYESMESESDWYCLTCKPWLYDEE